MYVYQGKLISKMIRVDEKNYEISEESSRMQRYIDFEAKKF